jgi:signal transduction histidine kinase
LYRVLQGALSNVLRHAKASRVKVALETSRNGALLMTIEDNGAGFDPSAQKPASVGLVAMRERVRVLGGRFHLESARAGSLSKRHGTRIQVEVPLPQIERTPGAHRPRARS